MLPQTRGPTNRQTLCSGLTQRCCLQTGPRMAGDNAGYWELFAEPTSIGAGLTELGDRSRSSRKISNLGQSYSPTWPTKNLITVSVRSSCRGVYPLGYFWPRSSGSFETDRIGEECSRRIEPIAGSGRPPDRHVVALRGCSHSGRSWEIPRRGPHIAHRPITVRGVRDFQIRSL